MKTYSYQEVIDASTHYFNGDNFAAKIFADKYALQNNDGSYEELDPSFMHKRLATEFARMEEKYPNPMTKDEIFELFDNFKYIVPQGSPMAGIGNPYQIMSISNCFVIDSPLDSYAGILHTDAEEVHIMRRRGGVGFDVSNIRPKGMVTANAAKTTDGIGLFLERYSRTCREVAQDGRRGALMLTLSVHHPEIQTFINIKKDKTKVTGANISIRISDEFMNAVKNDSDFELRWPVDSKNPTVRKTIRAKDLWDEITNAAWSCAEPGILFWDNVLNNTPAQAYKDHGFNHTSTNPCGELVLSPGDSCRLLVLNLTGFVEDIFSKKASFNFSKFREYVIKAQRLMDDMVDLELEYIDKILEKVHKDPQPNHIKAIEIRLWNQIKAACINGRRTGLGITGLGDCLAYLNIKYGSQASIVVTEEIYKTLALGSYESSCIMAKERGAFPAFQLEIEKDHPFISRIMTSDSKINELYIKYGRRNIANTTTAPAGTVSILTQTTSGIEPTYDLSYTRRKKINPDSKDVTVDYVDQNGDSWQSYTIYHHGLKKWMEVTNETDLTKSPYFEATAQDCDWKSGVMLQGVAQKWVCHSISRTANIPNDTPLDVVKDIYMMAWQHGCKGYTVYREGTRSGVLVSEDAMKQQKTDDSGRPLMIQSTQAPKRPKTLSCDIHQTSVKGTKWVVLVGLLQNKPYELFMGSAEQFPIPLKYKNGELERINKGRYNLSINDSELVIENIVKTIDDTEIAWATRVVSMMLRHGLNIKHICEQLSKEGSVVDVNNVISRILRKYIKDDSAEDCPKCPNIKLIFEEGCLRCGNCGFSKCG